MKEKLKKIKLQPRIPKIRKRKEHQERREHAGEAEERHHEEPPGRKPEMQDKRLLLGIGLVVVAVIAVLIVLWAYPPAPAGPANALTDSEVRAELARLDAINEYPQNMNINPADYPKALGIYSRSNLALEEIYFCSDVCPDYGRVYLIYQGVDSAACDIVGGREIRDLSWGGYIGCGPNLV